ncbi:unnamed protein product [Callosobruchus maculatus]|uniref:Protein kinase domain-containing protein n=1 Tax=Callosobruchus maculatus TaxID=64391 RepID=A0A653BX24_CALMS|nr:unnamed protein product [Callosobruchus maculatus]
MEASIQSTMRLLYFLMVLKYPAFIYAEHGTKIVEDLSIIPYLDHNRYIRLNISWGRVLTGTKVVSVRFKNTEDCNPVNDIEEHFIQDNQFLVFPSTEMEHPADYLQNRCKYEIILEDEDLTNETQSINYEVPECVSDKCMCRKVTDSPYKITSITKLYGNMYSVKWDRLLHRNLSVHRIYYHRNNDDLKTYTHVPDKYITYEKEGIKLPLPDLSPGQPYNFTVEFTDYYNECIYLSSIKLMLPKSNLATFMLILGGLFTTLMILLVMMHSSMDLKSSLKRTIKKFMPCKDIQQNNIESPAISSRNFKMESNVQYTPLEFILKVDQYDKYEIPRNKILLKDEIGSGAFGKVFKAHVYELNEHREFTEAAVKQLREGAPPEEIQDFYNEIATLKKIGYHENVVKLLGCVTIEEPYLMIMEYISGGSLKEYLKKLRKIWQDNRNNANVFFPDSPNDKMNYICCTFDNTDNCSYIEPNPAFPEKYLTPKAPAKHDEATDNNFRRRQISEGAQSNQLAPRTPSSFTSSRLPSTTETDSTSLGTEDDVPCAKPVLSSEELQRFAFQIATGMAHLEKVGVTHRDLAARNVLITTEKILKVSDFGMSRFGTYITSGRKCPVRWMSIEAIEERVCDSKSDVWSFGVVLWEIGTLGAFPYETTPDTMILHNLKQGMRLQRPEICTDELYSLILKCWDRDPGKRPTFRDLADSLDVSRRKIYLDFDQLHPKYIFPCDK